MGVLAQKLGPHKRAVAYFSKQLDEVSKEWPGCIRAIAATVLLIQEAQKFTLGQRLTVYTTHAVATVLEQKGGHWLSPSRFVKYQATLTEQDDVDIVTTSINNPTSFLSKKQNFEPTTHDYIRTIETVYASQIDLKEEHLEEVNMNLYTDRSSFVENGKKLAEYAVTIEKEKIEAKQLPKDTLAQ